MCCMRVKARLYGFCYSGKKWRRLRIAWVRLLYDDNDFKGLTAVFTSISHHGFAPVKRQLLTLTDPATAHSPSPAAAARPCGFKPHGDFRILGVPAFIPFSRFPDPATSAGSACRLGGQLRVPGPPTIRNAFSPKMENTTFDIIWGQTKSAPCAATGI